VTTTLSQKGQVVIPQEVRQKLSLRPGDDFLVLTSSLRGEILLRPLRRQSGADWLEALRGLNGLEVPQRSKEPGRNVTL